MMTMKNLVIFQTVFLIIQISDGVSVNGKNEHFNNVGLEVMISPDLPKHLCQRILKNFQMLMTSSSRVLQEETGQSISLVTVQLPSSWHHMDCTSHLELASIASFQEEDVLLTTRDPVFGSTPFPLQHAGCSERGTHVVLPFDELVQSQNTSKEFGLSFSKALISHLYGVFPTHGFHNDTRYPKTFKIGEVVLENSGCSAKNKVLCEENHYDNTSPTKQNMLCNNASPQQIIQRNFNQTINARESNKSPGNTSLNIGHPSDLILPHFRYVVQVKTRYIIVLDRTLDMDKKWKDLHNALHRFIMEFSAGDELAIVTYGTKARVNLEPTVITNDNKAGIHGRVPGRVGSDSVACHVCALDAAEELVSKSKTTLSVLILFSSSLEIENIKHSLKNEDIQLYRILLGSENIRRMNKVTKKESIYTIENNEETLLLQFSDTLTSIKQKVEKADSIMLQKFFEEYYLVKSNKRIEGKLTVEESLRSNLKFVINGKVIDDIEHFELTSPSGEKHKFPIVERGRIYFDMGGDKETGIWTYNIKIIKSISEPSQTIILSAYAEKTGQTRVSHTVSVKTWSDELQREGSKYRPVLLYAKIMQGDLPISGAKVVAKITNPDGETVDVILKDTGTGYPDITIGDGIYSAYFTSLSSQAGLYGVKVKVTDGGGSARVPYLSSGQAEDCCGSRYPTESSIPTPSFTRIIIGSSFYLSQGVQFFIRNGIPEMKDIFPPARITDLHVSEYVNGSLQVKLGWTAPGGDFNNGMAASYEIQCLDDINNQIVRPSHNISFNHPAEADSDEFVTVTLLESNKVFYYGIVSNDEAGNKSPISNLVPVFIRKIYTIVPMVDLLPDNVTSASLPSTVLEAFEDNLLVYIISGCITGIALIILVVIIISVKISKRNSERLKAPHHEMVKEISSPTLIHSSTNLPLILKDSNLSVLPNSLTNEYSLDCSLYKTSPITEDISWAILPSYSNKAFENSSDTFVDSGCYRAGEAVDNVSEFYRTADSEQVTYQNLSLNNRRQLNVVEIEGDISDNGTGTTSATDCENSETSSDKNLPPTFKDSSRLANGEFHSLVVLAGDSWSSAYEKETHGSLSVSGPLSLPGLNELDIQEKRRRRESFV